MTDFNRHFFLADIKIKYHLGNAAFSEYFYRMLQMQNLIRVTDREN